MFFVNSCGRKNGAKFEFLEESRSSHNKITIRICHCQITIKSESDIVTYVNEITIRIVTVKSQ